MNILLTGASGFIGRHVFTALDRAGHHVRVIGSKDTSETSGFDALIHCGWHGVHSEFHHQLGLQFDNVAAAGRLLDRHPVKTIIALGSQCEVYATHAYAQAKQAARWLFHDYCQARGVRFFWLRLFALYGPGQDESWVIPSVIKTLRANEPLDFTEGRQRYDFLHVTDAAAAIARVVASQQPGDVLDLASGHSIELREVVEMLKRFTGSTSPLNFGARPYPPGQVMNMEASPLFQGRFNWYPAVTLEAGLKQLCQ